MDKNTINRRSFVKGLVAACAASAATKTFGETDEYVPLVLFYGKKRPAVFDHGVELARFSYFEIPSASAEGFYELFEHPSLIDDHYKDGRGIVLHKRLVAEMEANDAKISTFYADIEDTSADAVGLYIQGLLERKQGLHGWMTDKYFRCSADGLRFAEECRFTIGSLYRMICNGEDISPCNERFKYDLATSTTYFDYDEVSQFVVLFDRLGSMGVFKYNVDGLDFAASLCRELSIPAVS